jgi:hypothetical protein
MCDCINRIGIRPDTKRMAVFTDALGRLTTSKVTDTLPAYQPVYLS